MNAKKTLLLLTIYTILASTLCTAQESPDTIITSTGDIIGCKITFINNSNIFFKEAKGKRAKQQYYPFDKVKDIKLNNREVLIQVDANILSKYPYLKKRIVLEKALASTKDSRIQKMINEVESTETEAKEPETSDLDFSFFSTQELKGMYKDAFENKDFDNIKLIQEELAKRQQAQASDQTSQLSRGSGDPLKGLNVSKALDQQEIGKYFALMIGIDNYNGVWLTLKNAVKDAKAVESLLKEKYRIDTFRTLYNELATRKNIMKELQWLVDNVTENDNVFIYYSGHGEFKKDLNKGYWVPVEAQTTETYEFISNSDILTFINGIKSNHTLLVSDACFSGDIFRGKTISVPFEQSSLYFNKVHGLKSRQALTSGGVEPVMDGGREGHSVFTYYLLEMLERNEDHYFDAGQLYNAIKIPVTNNSDQTPILQPIKNTGDEGGQFIFIRK